jgi:hypothetical protein
MAFAEDLDVFINTGDFAEAATVGASTVNGIFFNGYGESLDYAAGSKPSFLCKVADLPALTLGTTSAVISSATYTIVENQPDGHGLTTLILEAA